MKRVFFALLLLIPTPVVAREEPIIIESLAPLTIRDDRAYILFRRIRPEGVTSFDPILLRIPDDGQFNQDEGPENVHNLSTRRALVEGRPESIHLFEVLPGDYILYGAAGSLSNSLFHVCMCLGTVGFRADAGRITDIGYFMADFVHEVSDIPELRAESGFGTSSYGMVLIIGATIRPPRTDSRMPPSIPTERITPADFRAIGRYFDPRAMLINRLAPVPGILEYDGGHVVDPQTGQVVPDVLQ